jgi:hypothetical protein
MLEEKRKKRGVEPATPVCPKCGKRYASYDYVYAQDGSFQCIFCFFDKKIKADLKPAVSSLSGNKSSG